MAYVQMGVNAQAQAGVDHQLLPLGCEVRLWKQRPWQIAAIGHLINDARAAKCLQYREHLPALHAEAHQLTFAPESFTTLAQRATSVFR